ncbi:uncharacterized protein LOC127631432 [Xyrauchen texanus]|uniref:uncharacterized protein LOC127631432 n=1 Tax=Xyrauchen texanus TaxID=154827 RepID=UPI0022423A20|nr:uncharacterized protein LOC127631432 [Xyrauchen texanus]
MSFFTRSLQDLPSITANDVHRIIQTTSKTPTSKKDKGFKLYVSSYINNYEVSNKESGEVTVRSECFRSMRKSQKPHCLSVRESHPAGSVQVQKKQVQPCAVMWQLYCTRRRLLPAEAYISSPVFSCTETEQKWHKPRTMGIKPGPVNDMVIVSARPKERRLAEGIRSNLYKGVICPLPDISTLKVQEAYHGLSADEAPMITAMAISSDVPLIESMFGPVQEGSVLSYQLPVMAVPSTRPHTGAPSPPQLPLSDYRLGPPTCAFVFSEHQHHHLASLATSFETAHKVEKARESRVPALSGTN